MLEAVVGKFRDANKREMPAKRQRRLEIVETKQ
jgi:hypothetical protein